MILCSGLGGRMDRWEGWSERVWSIYSWIKVVSWYRVIESNALARWIRCQAPERCSCPYMQLGKSPIYWPDP